MKRTLLSLLLVNQIVWADCNIRTASLMTDTQVVGPVQNLVEIISEGRCAVKFNINVNVKWHSVEETESDSHYKGSALCSHAIRQGREKLLVSLGGQFNSESITVCQSGQKVERKIKAGDLILETEVGQSSVKWPEDRKYKNMRCRNFTEQYFELGSLKRYFGVICQANPNDSLWMVMDKW